MSPLPSLCSEEELSLEACEFITKPDVPPVKLRVHQVGSRGQTDGHALIPGDEGLPNGVPLVEQDHRVLDDRREDEAHAKEDPYLSKY